MFARENKGGPTVTVDFLNRLVQDLTQKRSDPTIAIELNTSMNENRFTSRLREGDLEQNSRVKSKGCVGGDLHKNIS